MAVPSVQFNASDQSQLVFFSTLRKRVDNYFKENNLSRNYNRKMILKSVILLSVYVFSFAALLFLAPSFGIALLIWSLMGIAKAGIGMSVMHDANHGAYSSNRKINTIMGHTINLVGGCVFNWKLQHNVLHHTYTNIVDLDEDIEDKLVMRFSPHKKVKWFHRFQFVYAFLFYGILTLYWAIAKDFVQFYKFTKSGLSKDSKKENRVTLVKIIFSKLIYFSVIIGIPLVVFQIPFRQLITGYLLMHFIAGVILSVVFQMAHTVEHTSHPLPDENNNIENSWAVHQMNTTVNFARKNKFISWYVGGLNFQVEHHLFPTVCHVHYPAIAPIVKATAEEFGIPYLEHITFGEALRSHVRTLKRFGKEEHLKSVVA